MRIDEFRQTSGGTLDETDLFAILTVGFDLRLVYAGQTVLNINPSVSLQISRDGGFTFGNERWRVIPRAGEYKKVVYWERLGRARNAAFRIVISDPVKVVILGASIDAEEGLS